MHVWTSRGLKYIYQRHTKSQRYFYPPMIEKKDAVMRNAYRTLMMAAMVIWVLLFVTKQMKM